MEHNIVITKTEDNWIFGNLGEYHFEVKRFDEVNEAYGLVFREEEGPGHISKLWVSRNYSTICSYDRGWDVLPRFKEEEDACEAIIRHFN